MQALAASGTLNESSFLFAGTPCDVLVCRSEQRVRGDEDGETLQCVTLASQAV